MTDVQTVEVTNQNNVLELQNPDTSVLIQTLGGTLEVTNVLSSVSENIVSESGQLVTLDTSNVDIQLQNDSQQVSVEVNSPVTNILEKCIQGPPGQAGTGITQVNYDNLTPTTNAVADYVAIADNWAMKWLITAIDTDGLTRSSEITAIHNSSTVKHTRANQGGDPVPFGVDVEISGSNMVLRVTNYHSKSLNLRIARFGVET